MKKLFKVQILILSLLLCLVINSNIVYADSDYEKWREFVSESEELDKASSSDASPKAVYGELIDINNCLVDASILSPGVLEIRIQSKCATPCDKMFHAVKLQKYNETLEDYETIDTYEFGDFKLKHNDFTFILGPEHTTSHAVKVGNLEPGTYRVRGLHAYYQGDLYESYSSKSRSNFVLSTPPTQSKYAELYFNTNLLLSHETGEANIMNGILTSSGYLFNSGYNPSAITLLQSFKRDKIVHYLGHGSAGYIDNQFGKVSGNEILVNVTNCPANFVYLEACLTANPSEEFGDVDDALYQVGADSTLAFSLKVSASNLTNGIHYFSTQLFKHMFEEHINLVTSADFAAQDLYDTYGSYYGADSRQIHGNFVFE